MCGQINVCASREGQQRESSRYNTLAHTITKRPCIAYPAKLGMTRSDWRSIVLCIGSPTIPWKTESACIKKTKLLVPYWAEKERTLSRISVSIKMVWQLTAHSHTRITMQNLALLIGWGTVACKKIPEDKRLAHLGKQTCITQRTQILQTLQTVRLPPLAEMLLLQEKKKEKASKIQTGVGKRKHVAEKSAG